MTHQDYMPNNAESYINWFNLMTKNNGRAGYTVAWAIWFPMLFLIIAYFIRG
ncbi:MAG: hypothetical protein AABZ31_07660 [Bdellovibrionota bacterium]